MQIAVTVEMPQSLLGFLFYITNICILLTI